jgi:hypothetical protein
MTTGAAGVILAAVVAVAACGGPTSMGGFGDRDARVTQVAPVEVDACTVRTGLLVIEVERAVINEYPHHDPAARHEEQPLLVRSLFAAGQPEHEGDVQAWVSPMRYRPGQPIGSFTALRLLERPMRAVIDEKIVVRLAENDRTSPASWNQVATVAGGAAGASAAAGVPVLPSAVVEEGVHLLAKMDRDDLILLWATDARSLVGALGAGRSLHFGLATPRRTPDGSAPAGSLELLIFRQPEPGCP